MSSVAVKELVNNVTKERADTCTTEHFLQVNAV